MKNFQIKNTNDFNKVKKAILKDIKKDISPDKIEDKTGKEFLSNVKGNTRKFSETGKLSGSFKVKDISNKVVIYSDLDYAEIQDKGGKIKVTDKMRKFAWAKYYDTKQSMWKGIALTKKSFIKIKAKEYSKVNINRLLNKVIKKLVK